MKQTKFEAEYAKFREGQIALREAEGERNKATSALSEAQEHLRKNEGIVKSKRTHLRMLGEKLEVLLATELREADPKRNGKEETVDAAETGK